jgi:hypothetical protein
VEDMTWTPWIEIEPLNPQKESVRKLYNQNREIFTGEPCDTVRLHSLTPEIATLIIKLNHAIHENANGLSVREQEITALIVSSFNN